jgi:hypothetical protein
MVRGVTPRMLIWVSGEASGVPGSGEIVGGDGAVAAAAPAGPTSAAANTAAIVSRRHAHRLGVEWDFKRMSVL